MLTQLPAGSIEYTLINGDGLRLGDGDTPPDAEVWRAIDPFVAAMASGRGGEEIAALGGFGVRYVLLAPGSAKELCHSLMLSRDYDDFPTLKVKFSGAFLASLRGPG